MSAHNKAAGFPQIKQIEEWEHAQHKPSSVCKLISQKWRLITVFALLGASHQIQREETTQDHEYQEVGIRVI